MARTVKSPVWTAKHVREWSSDISEEVGQICSEKVIDVRIGDVGAGSLSSSSSRHCQWNVAGDDFLETARCAMEDMKNFQVYFKDYFVTFIDHSDRPSKWPVWNTYM